MKYLRDIAETVVIGGGAVIVWGILYFDWTIPPKLVATIAVTTLVLFVYDRAQRRRKGL